MFRRQIPLIVVILLAAAKALAADRLELDETSVHGTRELPKVMYIVPWKNVGASVARPAIKRRILEPLAPIDPTVFRRKLRYYQQAAQNQE